MFTPVRQAYSTQHTHKRSSNPLRPLIASLLLRSSTLNIGVYFTAPRNDDIDSLQPNPATA
jgi:hypothetical protein